PGLGRRQPLEGSLGQPDEVVERGGGTLVGDGRGIGHASPYRPTGHRRQPGRIGARFGYPVAVGLESDGSGQRRTGMAEADIAFVAAAGATGLAVAVSVWAWRFRLHAARRLQLASSRADAAEA